MNTQRCLITAGVLIVSLLAFRLEACAQNAQLSGITTDANSAVIAGAQLTLTNVDTSVALKGVTNAAGYYNIPFVLPGHYQLHVLASGFKPVTRNNLSINVNEFARIDLPLEIGALNENVNITANGPLLERDTSSIGQVVLWQGLTIARGDVRLKAHARSLLAHPTRSQEDRTRSAFTRR